MSKWAILAMRSVVEGLRLDHVVPVSPFKEVNFYPVLYRATGAQG